MGRRRLGEILLEGGAIHADALQRALEHARTAGVRLGVALRQLGLVDEPRLVQALAESLGLPVADVGADDLDWSALHLLRPEFCEAHDLLPFAFEEGRGRRGLRVAMADPLDVPAIDEIEFTTGLRVRPAVAGRDAIRAALVRWLRRDRARPAPSGDEGMLLIRAGGVQELIPPAAPAPAPPPVDFTRGEARPTAPAPPRRSVSDDLAYLTGDAPGPVEARLARLEARQEALIRLLAERGLLGTDALRRFRG